MMTIVDIKEVIAKIEEHLLTPALHGSGHAKCFALRSVSLPLSLVG